MANFIGGGGMYTHLISHEIDSLNGPPPTQVHTEEVVSIELQGVNQNPVQSLQENSLDVPGILLSL